MRTLTMTMLKENLAKTMELVCEDHDPIVINRRNSDPVVLISLEDYESLNETSYLLQSPNNARRLMESMEELESGRGQERKIRV